MNGRLLIDAIVRQTTVLVAQLSTAAGIRAPLAHVADEVFVARKRETPTETAANASSRSRVKLHGSLSSTGEPVLVCEVLAC